MKCTCCKRDPTETAVASIYHIGSDITLWYFCSEFCKKYFESELYRLVQGSYEIDAKEYAS